MPDLDLEKLWYTRLKEITQPYTSAKLSQRPKLREYFHLLLHKGGKGLFEGKLVIITNVGTRKGYYSRPIIRCVNSKIPL